MKRQTKKNGSLCKLCGGQKMVLGSLGWTRHFRCRGCGAESSQKVRRPKKKNPSREDRIRQEYPAMKAALKRIVASRDNDAIIRHVDAATSRFEEIGYPDQWQDWERAKDDAETAKRFSKPKWNPTRRRASTKKILTAWWRSKSGKGSMALHKKAARRMKLKPSMFIRKNSRRKR